ncbi:MAG: hypothetical protein U0520_00415 [Candidatus Saccharimonadales bacterium]
MIFVIAKILQEKDGSKIIANSPQKEAILKASFSMANKNRSEV